MTRIQGKAPERAEANDINNSALSRWFNGGKGLDNFREAMLNDNHITHLVDDQNTKDCFPGISIEGGEMPKNLQYWAFAKKYKAKTEL